MTQMCSNGMGAVPLQSVGKRLASDSKIHMINCVFHDKDTKKDYEESFGYFNRDAALECKKRQEKRADCVSCRYIDPDLMPKKADEGEAHV